MDRRLCFIVSAIFFFVNKNEAARILAVFPVPSISHQVVFRPLTQELARRGHAVTIWTTDPAFPPGKSPPNITEIDLHEKSYKLWRETFVASVDGKTDPLQSLRIGFGTILKVFEMQFLTEEVQNVLKTKKFDLLMVEACVRTALMLSIVVKDVPIIQVSSFGAMTPNFHVHGAPIHPTLYPDMLNKKVYNLTVFDKLEILKYNYDFNRIALNEEPMNNLIKKHFGNNVPTINELEDKVDMLFLNVNPIWDGNRPVPPGIIHMGGLHNAKPVKELPKDLQTHLDSSKHGVIYMSLGTNVNPSLLPPEKIEMFLRVFSKLPYDVLLKWDKDELPSRPKNVKIFKWLPQSDLLRHPKIKLFITQGGLQSSDEAITAGVPLIAFPMLGDQWFNAEKYERHQIGVKLAIETVTDKILEDAIDRVIHDPSFRENIQKLSNIMRDEPQTPLERVVWWTEYVIRHKGAKHLRSPAANIHWTEYYMIDVIIVLGIGAIFSFSIFVMLILLTLKSFSAPKSSTKSTIKKVN